MRKVKSKNLRIRDRALIAVLCLVMLVLCISPAFAEGESEFYEIDPYTNKILSDLNGNGTETISTKRLSTNCTFDTVKRVFEYSVGSDANSYVTASVFNNEYVSDPVTVDASNADNVVVYKDGEALETKETYNLKAAGNYAVRNGINGDDVLTFQILPESINNLNRFEIPSIFYVVNAYVDDQKIPTGNVNYIKLEEEGAYTIKYNSSMGVSRTVRFTIDRTAPELEIIGVENGAANGPISIGETEENSTLEVYFNGDPVSIGDKYSTPGKYHMVYTDAAGNITSYDFTIKMYLNVSAGLVIVLTIAILLALVVYMKYLHMHMRTY